MKTVNLIVAALATVFFVSIALVGEPAVHLPNIWANTTWVHKTVPAAAASPETSRALCKLYQDKVWELLFTQPTPLQYWHITFCK